ncbi:MAG: OmpH family outer membrane protein [Spirochaetales bacterium]|nr:OmpH family outer membrane protein [Spirochaetales bacterium]
MKRTIVNLLLFSLVLTVVPVHGEQLTTVGIVDINRVYNSFFRDSQEVRELERLRREYQEEIDEQVARLEALRDRRLLAQEQGNSRRVEDLDEEILQLQRFLEDLTRRRRQQLETRQSGLLSNDFLRRLQDAIQFVAESEGYTVVLRTDVAGLQWWSAEVDISDLVVQRLVQMGER